MADAAVIFAGLRLHGNPRASTESTCACQEPERAYHEGRGGTAHHGRGAPQRRARRNAWLQSVRGLLRGYLGGDASAAPPSISLREGKSRRLAAREFPKKLEDTRPTSISRGRGPLVEYREGVFVGYAIRQKKRMSLPVRLRAELTSEYSNLRLSAVTMGTRTPSRYPLPWT